MEQNNSLKIFENKNVRVAWNGQEEKWYFSVVDVIAILTDNEYQQARNYWKVLKLRLKEEGNESVTNCNQLKMQSADGKYYKTDVMDTEGVLRIIQSIPSKKAEPFKLWLAKVGRERIDETYDPEITINRALETYRRKGYSEEWINQRLKTIDVRKEFTDELQRSGINSQKDFATLTNILTETWSGYTVREYKNLKGFECAKSSVVKGGSIAKMAKEQLEKETGKKIISNKNAKEIRKLGTSNN